MEDTIEGAGAVSLEEMTESHVLHVAFSCPDSVRLQAPCGHYSWLPWQSITHTSVPGISRAQTQPPVQCRSHLLYQVTQEAEF